MKYKVLFILVIVFLSQLLNAQKEVSSNDSNQYKIELDIKNVQQFEKLLHKEEKNWISKYGTLVIAFSALIITLITTLLSNKNSARNTIRTLETTKLLETKKNQLENISEFIALAVSLNKKIIMLKKAIGNNCTLESAYMEYHKTYELRNKLTSTCFKIIITLNNSQEQKELTTYIESYINLVHNNFDFQNITSDNIEIMHSSIIYLSKKIINS